MAGALLIIGAGAMAEALAAALAPRAQSGTELFSEVLVWARRPEPREALAARHGLRALASLADLTAHELAAIVICVRDGAIADVANALADAWPAGAAAPRPVVMHTSGFHDVEVLAALAPLGFERAVLHPCVSISGLTGGAVASGAAFEGVRFGLSGEGAARTFGSALAALLGGSALEVASDQRPLYHTAAALLSGGWVALFAEAEALFAEAMPGADPQELRQLALALATSTLDNLRAKPTAAALTGPVARGDDQVVAGHLAQLERSHLPERAALYTELVAAMRRLLADAATPDRND